VGEAIVIQRLWARGFRNFAELSLSPGPRFNVIHGDNGQGKSNLLEVIDYLASLRSFRGAATGDLIARGTDVAELGAELIDRGVPRKLAVRLKRHGAREVKLDGKRPRSHGGYYQSLPLVIFHPADVELASGAPEPRRAFLDRVLEQFDPTYASSRAAYERALRSRNRLLRSERVDTSAVRAFDEVLAAAGAVVGQARARLATELSPLVTRAYRDICGEELALSIAYQPRVEPTVEALRERLHAELERDVARGYTGSGPHADDVLLSLDDVPARRFGSQGQHRAIVLALKVAELHELGRRVGRVPVLLLDDVSSELDRSRNRALFQLLAQLGGQVFLTTTHPEFILLEEGRRDYHVQAGRIVPEP